MSQPSFRPGPLGMLSRPDPARSRVWLLAAWVAGGFTLLVGLTLIVGDWRAQTEEPLHSVQLQSLKEKLRLAPADEALRQKVRDLDWQLRRRYFHQLWRTRSGSYLLLGGLAVFVCAATQAGRFWGRPAGAGEGRGVEPGLPPVAASQASQAAVRARGAVALTGTVIGAALFCLSLSFNTRLPRQSAELEKLLGGEAPSASAAPAVDAASAEELAQNWPRFRGLGGGVSAFTNAPAAWDTNSGAGILWKVPVPAPGFNSPIVWGERIFLSGGDANLREVFCLALQDGQVLWRQAVTNVPGSPTTPLEIPDSTGYAAATMATDGRRVYVIFANGDVAAFTLEGRTVWARSFGPLKNAYGHAASLATWQDRLIVQLDQGESEEGKSKLYALDGRTGKTIWQTPRKVGGSWASPIVVEAAGKPQIITLAVPHAIAYSALDGSELWRVECLNGEVTPSPVFAGGLVLVASPSDKLLGIRPSGQGDVTKTHVAWSAGDNVPDVSSPVSNGELVFTLSTPGILTCYEAKSGQKLWEKDLEMDCYASPSIAGNRLYCFSQKGAAVVVEAGRQFKELFRTQMGEGFHASPAFVQDKMILRGLKNVWCIGPAKKQEAKEK